MRNKISTPTQRKARPSRSHPEAPALEGLSSYLGAPLSPETQKNPGGRNRDLVEQEDRAGRYNSLLLKRLLGPSFPSLRLTAHFT